MFYGVTHVDVPVKDLARARRLYSEILPFPVRKEGEGFVDVDTGTVLLRLVQVARAERHVTLRVEVPDVQAALDALVKAGAQRMYEPMRTPALELTASVRDPDGHAIIVWRELTEDEYGFTPELPKQMSWQPESEELLKELLRSVPALFRALARRKVVQHAEWVAREGQRPVVVNDDVVRGFILGNAKITRDRAREPLRKAGYDPEAYRDEFEAD